MKKKNLIQHAQTQHYDAKDHQWWHWVPLVLAVYSWAWGLHLIFLSTETPLEKTNVLFASGYRLETVSELKMGAVRVTTSPLSFRTLTLYRPMEAFCMLPKSLLVPMCTSPSVPGSPCFLGVLCPLWLLTTFPPPLSLNFLSPY